MDVLIDCYQVELLELVLVQVPLKTLTRALSVSKHCRDVILGNQELRKKLFLEPAQATEWLSKETWILPPAGTSGTFLCRRPVTVQGLDQKNRRSRIIVEVHPILEVMSRFKVPRYKHTPCVLDYRDPRPDSKPDLPCIQTDGLFCEVVKKVPAQTLLFQPPVANVKMYHHDSMIPLSRREGVTFGMVAEQLKKMNAEDNQHFREQNELIIQNVVKQPLTPTTRQLYASARKVLNGPRDRNWCTCCGARCLRFEVKSAISNDSKEVREARLRMDWAN